MEVKVGAKIKNALKRDREVIFTTTREDFPLVADHGAGDFIYDIEGNRFIDFSSFVSCYNLGVNGNALIRAAAKKQIDRLMHGMFMDYYEEPPVRLAERLVGMLPPGFGRAFFSNSGTEANEDAIKLVKLFTKRRHIIAFYGAFHGRSMGSLALTASKTAHRAHFGPFVNVSHAPYPDPYRFDGDPEDCSQASIDFIEQNILKREVPPEEVAAIFFEPIQGEGGYIVPPRGFFKELRRLADKHGILLVDDEIQAGYMRTGKFLALSNFGTVADIYTFAKSFGAGFPLAATVARKSLGDTPAGAHAGTFGGNLVASAAASASLDYIKHNMRSLQKGIVRKGGKIMKRMNELKERYEYVGDVRGIGLMIGVELVKSKSTKEYAPNERNSVIMDCFKKGLVLLPAGRSAIRIIPPLTVSDGNIDKGLDILEEAIKKNAK
ncbi:MAG: aminotransferase class III-fold pyridoxal phosphate-dependent enzyme [Candidatus Micrarchaeota archaeon]|nr:aminotransferase class III-fold pyridoxal phosphate-dependent enzyme [Candidatus Micrarchaeota archaeon]